MTDWPRDGGEMAARIRAFDWAATPLGPLAAWPQSRRTAVDIALASDEAMLLALGPARIVLYNDAYAPLLSDQHPGALGRPHDAAWPALRDRVAADTGHAGKQAGSETESDAALRHSQSTLARELANSHQLQAVSSLLIEGQDAELLYGRILEAAMAIMRADCASIQTYDPERKELALAGHRNLHPESARLWMRLPAHITTCCKALYEGVRCMTQDAAGDDPEGGEAYRLSGIRSVQSTPLTSRDGRPLGMISTHWRSVFVPGEQDLRSFDVLARQTADAFERAGAARAIRESEDRLRALVTASSTMIYRMSPDWRQMRQLSGRAVLTDTVAPNDDWAALYLLPEDQPAIFDKIHEAIRTRSMFELEHRVRLSDGGVGWVLSRAVPIFGADGAIEEWFGAGSDVTQRRRAEDAVRDSEELLRQFGEASQDILWVRDAATLQWQYLSPAFEAVYGVRRQDVLAGDNYRNWQQAIVPEDRAYAAACTERLARGEPVEFEYRVRRPADGQLRWLRDTGFPMRAGGGQVTRIGGVGHDVTAIKEVEAALADAEGRQRVLLEGMPQLVWRAADDGCWTWAGPQWCAHTGLSDEASRGHGWLQALHPDDRAAALDAWRQARDDAGGRHAYQADHRIRHGAGGDYRWFQSRGSAIRRADGSVAEWLGTSTDIDAQVRAREFLTRAGEELERRVAERTAELREALDTLHRESIEREQAEDRLRQSEKLKAIGQLTGGIAHDFNNMLQGISSALALVRTRLGQGRVSDATAYIEPAMRAASRAGALTHRLLAFSRQQTLTPEPVNMDQIAQGMEDMIRRTVGPGVQVELKLADGHWLVLCDPNQLESALLNLCVNARDAMPEGGWLTISTEERELSARELAEVDDLQPGGYATLAVTDTGTGMPPEVAARVFEPFFTTKPLGRGTGLGLSQIYGFIHQSGGLVQIEAAAGKGTTVRLCLPFYEMSAKEQPGHPLNGRTLLLVEDEHDVRRVLSDQLRDLGYRVLEADAAEAALRVLRTGVHVDLLVTNVGLREGISGRQLAASVRQDLPALPVIFITGFAGIEMLGREDVLRKPFETATLAHLVEQRLATAPDTREANPEP